jgi:hypothetical protein
MAFQYEVPGITLIRQDQDMACWFASAMMLLNWKERFRPEKAISSNAVDERTIRMYMANNWIQNDQIIPLAVRLGLIPIPPQSPSIDGFKKWLMQFGPLWTNGAHHIVVIGGLKEGNKREYMVKVYDPWPGTPIGWRSLSGWYVGFDAAKKDNATRDTGIDVQAVFLHV